MINNNLETPVVVDSTELGATASTSQPTIPFANIFNKYVDPLLMRKSYKLHIKPDMVNQAMDFIKSEFDKAKTDCSGMDMERLDKTLAALNECLANGTVKRSDLLDHGLLHVNNEKEVISFEKLNKDSKEGLCTVKYGATRSAYIYPDGTIYKISRFVSTIVQDNSRDLRLNQLYKEPVFKGALEHNTCELSFCLYEKNKYLSSMIIFKQPSTIRQFKPDELVSEELIKTLHGSGYRMADVKPTNFAIINHNGEDIQFPIDAKFIGRERSNSLRSDQVKEHLAKSNIIYHGKGMDSYDWWKESRSNK